MTCLVLLLACKGMEHPSSSRVFTVDNEAIPPAFGKTGSTLLCVMHGYTPYDTLLRNQVKSHFDGSYDFVMPSELSKGTYANFYKYRFVFDHEVFQKREPLYDPFSEAREVVLCTKYQFYVRDRKKDEKYESPLKGRNFGKIIHFYMKALEKKRDKEAEKQG